MASISKQSIQILKYLSIEIADFMLIGFLLECIAILSFYIACTFGENESCSCMCVHRVASEIAKFTVQRFCNFCSSVHMFLCYWEMSLQNFRQKFEPVTYHGKKRAAGGHVSCKWLKCQSHVCSTFLYRLQAQLADSYVTTGQNCM